MKLSEEVLVAHTRISENGRIVVPASMRERLGLRAGDAVVLTFEDGRLWLQSHRAVMQAIQEDVRALAGPRRSLSEELIADRREEARQEMEEAGQVRELTEIA